MNEYLFYQHRYNTVKTVKKQNCVDWTERLKKALTTALVSFHFVWGKVHFFTNKHSPPFHFLPMGLETENSN